VGGLYRTSASSTRSSNPPRPAAPSPRR